MCAGLPNKGVKLALEFRRHTNITTNLWWSLRTLNVFARRELPQVTQVSVLCLCDAFRALINSLVC